MTDRTFQCILATAILLGLVLPSCNTENEEDHMHAQTATICRYVCKSTHFVMETEGTEPPTRMGAFVGWLAAGGMDSESYIDYEARSIRDVWGNELVLVSEGGELVGIGSCGPDGIWHSGSGDDIVEWLRDVQ